MTKKNNRKKDNSELITFAATILTVVGSMWASNRDTNSRIDGWAKETVKIWERMADNDAKFQAQASQTNEKLARLEERFQAWLIKETNKD